MNTQTVARLEALLERVRRRGAEPRAARTAPVVAAAPPAPVMAAPAPAAPALPATEPPPPPLRPQQTEADIVLEVEVAVATQDTIVAVAAEEVVAPAALESRERLVVAEPVAAEAPPTEIHTREPEPVPEPEVAAAEVSDDEIEEAPASSRRPVGPQPEERLAEMAFGAEEPSPPRHTPPPESGRLPAAPPVQEFDGDTTGVRDAKPVTRHPESGPEPQPAAELAPVAVRADIAPNSSVADVVGRSERATPSKFVELLDASLAL
ncbi:MAG TPA: hypothetical protein VF765_37505 [Polyangiaceae bacterium]